MLGGSWDFLNGSLLSYTSIFTYVYKDAIRTLGMHIGTII